MYIIEVSCVFLIKFQYTWSWITLNVGLSRISLIRCIDSIGWDWEK